MDVNGKDDTAVLRGAVEGPTRKENLNRSEHVPSTACCCRFNRTGWDVASPIDYIVVGAAWARSTVAANTSQWEEEACALLSSVRGSIFLAYNLEKHSVA